MDASEEDELVSTFPIYYSDTLSPNLQLHQFPLLTRPLQAPPTAVASGKPITARVKPQVGRLEIHVPVDTRPEVCNHERAKQLGAAQLEDDREKNQERKDKHRDGEDPRLSEVRLQSDRVVDRGVGILGNLRDGKLYLHPVSEVHQFRPTLTYLDFMTKKNRRRGGDSDSDSDDGPPPDPDEAPVVTAKKEKKPGGEAKEVQVTTRKTDDQAGYGAQSGLSTVRREILHLIRAEEEEEWELYGFHDVESTESAETFSSLFAKNEDELECGSKITTYIKSIKGL